MGKYMKKSRISEVSPQQVIASGVRTRAKTLALQKQGHVELDASSLSYLELRSRRLHKLSPSSSLPSRPLAHRQQSRRFSDRSEGDEASIVENEGDRETEDCVDGFIEASLGENDPELEEMMDRTTRESTPCSLIRNPITIRAPGSTTRRGPHMVSQRVQSQLLGDFPTMQEMEEFFTLAEEQQQKLFLDKYNFDIVKDSPIPGRFEWVQVV
ncbi:hypothetical protein SAY87_004549 [Trapa incisa]|uniref:Cyclin-dependent kinase inhibitor n=1 Tax=Trapa incisa TaxID=236973 RepID=A0AAN7PKT8_9MYRT|nr:hypothetical protein SAY87_004549 [Trapa incisa]